MRPLPLLFVVCMLSPLAGEAANWSRLDPMPVPPRRMAHSSVVDSQRDRMLLFGGANETSGFLGGVWSLSLDLLPTWTALSPVGPPPSARWDHAAVYDPIADRMLVYGGADDESPALGDVWSLSLDDPITWTEIHPQGPAPVGRSSHTAVFDPIGNRLLVHGGFDGGIDLRGDLWELSLADPPTWREVEITGEAPVPRRDAVAVYDALRSRVIVHGGNGGFAPFLSDTWALDLATSTWTELEPGGIAPEGAITHAGSYDSARDRFVVFGGSYHNETWALPFAIPLAWQAIAPTGALPPGRIDHTLVYAPATDRLIAFGGHTGLAALDDAWVLDPGHPVDVAQTASEPRLRVTPNPAARSVSFSLPGSVQHPARIMVYDVRGRLIRVFPAVAGHVPWDLRDSTGHPVAAGSYVCWLRSNDGVQGQDVVRLVVRR